MNTESSLAIFTRASQLLVEADTIQKTKELKDMALTAKEWARRKQMGKEAERYCYSYALEAERKMGQMLAATQLSKGGNPQTFSAGNPKVLAETTLKELGVSKKESSEAQMLARLPDENFQELCQQKVTMKEVKKNLTAKKPAKIISLPEGIYDVIYADPPWKYDFSETDSRSIERHYPTMSLEEIKTLKVPSAPNCVLFLWATAPKLKEALAVMDAWGFEYKTNAIWDKGMIGMGYWFRGRHELLLVGVKGKVPPPPQEVRKSSVFLFARDKEHSRKPHLFYELIEEYFPESRYLELFARSKKDKWEVWGNETERFQVRS